ncbi:uncharacterized protein LY89DRAFT_673783 [Mollisia scopiformis]|uniref:Calcofluor white hypersensitive protein n=1 Tax=Mollisia scopiformis TaxID=149040 RepID=A0A194WVJ1_MOLSC|nr:uncharacterized protein LY89DRAFT_673783 [Mollisia scopiformis]KUJ11988.1 hypothetical protein LY89DRAFT_673783 [Mollisia scopiformis]
MAQRKSNTALYLGVAAAGGVGYYLYTAGGSPKVAEKQFEADVSKASAKVQEQIPGRTNQAQKEGEKWASVAGAKVDSAVEKGRAELAKAEGKLDQYRKEASADTMKKIDQADKKIEEKAAQAKSGISSWFGGK